jgi:TolB-like protein/DNA-binding winged helix-turn-helix (wHTH) protein/Flp pilus assembly protein TadD
MNARSSARRAMSRKRAEIGPKSSMQREPDANLRHAQRLAWPGFVLDLARGELLDAAGRPTELRAQALKVLLVLGEQAGQVVAKDALMRRVWGDVIVTEDSLVQAVGDIRRVLGDARHERVRTIPRRGYLFELPPPELAPAVSAAPAAARPARLLSLPSLLGVAGLLLVVTLAAVMAVRQGGTGGAAQRSLAILPFEAAAATDDWFVDGVTGDLTTLLAGWPELRLIGRGTMARYKGKGADPRDVAHELGVRYVLTGRARRDGDQVRLEVSLVDASGRVVWSELRDVPRAELDALVGDIAGGMARALIVPFGDAVAADARRLAPHQVQADDLALQGIAELLRSVSKPHFERARELFEQAVALDPNSRRGLGGVALANANLVMWEWADDPRAATARAQQALARLDVVAPEALITKLSHASMAMIRRDWSGHLAIGDRLAALYPNEPTSHHHRCSALLRLARFQDSIDACRRAMRISPRDSRVPTWQGLIGFNEFQLGRHAAAESVLRDSVTANPRVPFYSVVLAAAIAEQGRRDEAAAVVRDVAARHPTYRAGTLVNYWVATEARFIAGRDRIARIAAELGLPP